MARDEVGALTLCKENIENDLKNLLLPKDPNDEKNVIIEIRAGTGGEEHHQQHQALRVRAVVDLEDRRVGPEQQPAHAGRVCSD